MEEEQIPLYVNTLIASDEGLRQLEAKMYEIRQQQDRRRA
jgi:hypothetical protein